MVRWLWCERLCAGGCSGGPRRKAPAIFCLCWTAVRGSPPGTARGRPGGSKQGKVAGRGFPLGSWDTGPPCQASVTHLLSPWGPLSCRSPQDAHCHGKATLPAAHGRGHTRGSSPWLGVTRVAVALLGPCPEELAGLQTCLPAADPLTYGVHRNVHR